MRDQPAFTDLKDVLDYRHDFLHGKKAVEIAGVSELLESRTSVLRWHANQYRARILGADIRVIVAARSPEESDVKKAQRVENFDYALYDDMTRYGGLDANSKSVHQQVCYCYGLLHLNFAPDVMEALIGKKVDDPEELRKLLPDAGFKKNPFVLESPDLKATYYEPDLSRWCEVGEQKVADLLAAYEGDEDLRRWITSTTMEENQSIWERKVDLFHLETSDFIYDVVQRAKSDSADDSLALQVRPNLAGRPCYFLVPAHEGSETSIAERHRPLIDPIYEPVQVLNILRTLLISGALQTGRVTYQEVPDGARGATDFIGYLQMPAKDRPVLHSPSKDDAVVTAQPGFHLEALPVPDQQWLVKAEETVRMEIDRMGFPAALATDMPLHAEATSGYHAARQMEAASDHLEPALTGRAKAFRNIFQCAHDIIQETGLSVAIPVQQKAQGRGRRVQEVREVDPDDFKEHNLDVSFESVPASVKMAMEESLMRKHDAGWISRQSGMEQLHDDPVDEQRKMDLEQVREPLKQMALQDALAIVQEGRGVMMEQAATEAGVQLPPAETPAGGPAPGQEVRAERPPEGAFPGVGAPLVSPEQVPPGEVAPPSMGGEMQGVAP